MIERPPVGRYDRPMPHVDDASAPPFVVELPLFSGPFRLLADLILEQKIDVCDIPVASVTERFVRVGAEMAGGWSLEEATWFVAVCALLLELKVGRLLPRARPDTEEDLLGGESPDLLYARSIELAAFRRVSSLLAERLAEAALLIPRAAGPPPELAGLYPDVLAAVGPQDVSHVTPIRASLSEALRAVRERLEASPEARFRDLVEGCRERIEVVVRFLAILELYREGKVELAQATRFGDIEVRWQGSVERSTEPSPDPALEVHGDG
jgi:segregation and condensation protein A